MESDLVFELVTSDSLIMIRVAEGTTKQDAITYLKEAIEKLENSWGAYSPQSVHLFRVKPSICSTNNRPDIPTSIIQVVGA